MKRSAVMLICLLFIPPFASTTKAQIAVGITDEDRAEFARHRAALLERLGEDMAVIFGSYSRGDNLRFRQNNRFYYLTGVELPFAALVLDGRSGKATLFLPPARSGRRALYNGETIGPDQAAVEEFGIAAARPVAELEAFLKETVPEGGSVWTVLLPEETVAGSLDVAVGARAAAAGNGWSARQSREQRISEWLKKTLPGVAVKDVSGEIDDLRRVKSEWEIELMAEACRAAGEGHVAAMRATRPGVYEYEIEAAAKGAFVAGGAFYSAYNAIVGSGPNNLVLHYSLSARRAEDGELVLMDFGPDYRYYCADITRTWPASGKFTPEQRKVYLDCLEIQRKLIERARPGVTLAEIRQLNKDLMKEMGYEKNYLHGPSHYLGMAVHDVGQFAKPLEPGVVITVEPGIYFLDEGWGIRIEDVLLVTDGGSRLLSDMILKHPDEIEALMAGSAAKNP